MKRILITFALILTTLLGYSQATNVGTVRIQNATTPFDRNLPISTRVINMATGERWITNTGVLGTATLTTAAASFDADSGGSEATTVSDTAEIDLTLTGTDIDASIVTGSIDVLKLDAGVQASLALADSALQSFTEVDGSTTNELQVLDQSQLNGRTLELSLSNDSEATKNIDLSSVNYTRITDYFEEDDGTATTHTLSQTAISGQGVVVRLNDYIVKPANYTFTTTSITISGLPVSQYDQVSITYSY